MLSKRLAAAGVLLPLIYLYVMRLPETYFFLLIALAALVGMAEFFSMYRVKGLLKYVCLFLGTILFVLSYRRPDILADAFILSIMTVMAVRLFSRKETEFALRDISAPLIGMIYIPGLLAFQIPIRGMGPEWILFLYSTVWAADSAAYFFGKGFGKRKLYPSVSPNKTVAGGVGSLAGGAFGAFVMGWVFIPQLPPAHGMLIGMIIGGVTIIGDLVESMFKRDAGVKDSGTIIPGHGGILDKIDGVLYAGPVLYWTLKMMNRITL